MRTGRKVGSLMEKEKKSFWPRWLTRQGWKSFFDVARKLGVNPAVFIMPTVLALFSALADGVSVGLLVPVVKGVFEKNFQFIYQKPALRNLVEMLPGDLSRNYTVIFAILVSLIFFFALTKNILVYYQSILTAYQVRELANKTRKLIHERYLSFGKMYFDRVSFGHLHQVLIGHTQQIAQELSNLQHAAVQFFSLTTYLTIGFFISWPLMVFSMIVFPVLHYSMKTLIRKIKVSSVRFSEAYSAMGDKISNALSCIMLVKAYSHESREKQWFDYVSDRVRNVQYSIDKKQRLIGPFQEIVGLCITLLLVGFMAFLLHREGAGKLAGFMVFFLVVRRMSQNFGVFSLIQSTLAGILGPVQELRSILNDEEKFFIPEGARFLDRFRDKIEFKQLSFSYVESRPILEEVSFSVNKGETVAIVGSSGSGKTTLANLLMRFYDSAPGSILIDGVDIREFTIQSLRAKMALVSQETYLLNASFKINLLYGLTREVSAAELDSVLEKARLKQLTKLIGIEAPIGERGVKLSGGERQRVSIARAILKDPELLLLDEATSALDTATEGLIQAALSEAAKDKTVIVIAHRLSTIQHADRIIVLERGQVVEEGTFNELLANSDGHFYSYWQSQKLRSESGVGDAPHVPSSPG
jgi:ATP-binding cassette, subfamily B, bacterial MsbA